MVRFNLIATNLLVIAIAVSLLACGGGGSRAPQPGQEGGSEQGAEEQGGGAESPHGEVGSGGDGTTDEDTPHEEGGGEDAGETLPSDTEGRSEGNDADGDDAEGERDSAEEPLKEPCDDGIPCTIGEFVQPNGSCGGGLFICGDCAGSECAVNADCKPFEDDNACNGRLRCAEGRCVLDLASVVTCGGGSATPETVRRCNPLSGKCEDLPLPSGSKCDDKNPCTSRDVVQDGSCAGVEICAPCAGQPEGAACDDADPCTSLTTCQSGRCIGTFTCTCASNSDCSAFDDGNLCNGTWRCINNECVAAPDTVLHCKRACPTSSCLEGICLPEVGQCTGNKKPECL